MEVRLYLLSQLVPPNTGEPVFLSCPEFLQSRQPPVKRKLDHFGIVKFACQVCKIVLKCLLSIFNGIVLGVLRGNLKISTSLLLMYAL